MPNVVRFTLPTARYQNISGVGSFVAGVLDVDANDLEAVSRARFLTKPYGAIEVGIVNAAAPKPTLPAVPATPNPDPYPQYPTMDEIVASPALRAAFVPFWSAAEAVTAGDVRMSPDGETISANSTRTTGAAWDTTEEANWTIVSSGGGSSLTPGTATGDILVWDGNSYEPATPTEATAADIPFTPTGTIAATDVQAAIAEVAAEAGSGGGGGDGDAWLGYATTAIVGTLAPQTITANRGYWIRVTKGAATASKLGVNVGDTSDGNICMAVYRNTGTGPAARPGARAATTGIVACPAANTYTEFALDTAVAVAPGDWLAISSDSATAKFHTAGSNSAGTIYGPISGYAASAPPLPATAPTLTSYSRSIILNAVA